LPRTFCNNRCRSARGSTGAVRRYGFRAAGRSILRASAGLLITEATAVSPQGNGWVGSPGIYTEKSVQGWRIANRKLKPTGTPIFLLFLQLSHRRGECQGSRFQRCRSPRRQRLSDQSISGLKDQFAEFRAEAEGYTDYGSWIPSPFSGQDKAPRAA
jgi:2,4-dienoyl-CoA reductase-like NADH-dependent reductase (Old Yellow Enzyme family)